MSKIIKSKIDLPGGSQEAWFQGLIAEADKVLGGGCPPHSWDRSGERWAKRDADWIGRYHSGTPGRKERYKQKLEERMAAR